MSSQTSSLAASFLAERLSATGLDGKRAIALATMCQESGMERRHLSVGWYAAGIVDREAAAIIGEWSEEELVAEMRRLRLRSPRLKPHTLPAAQLRLPS